MAETQTIKAIRTQAGDLKIDYTALENKPTPKKFGDNSVVTGDFADAKSFQDQINSIGKIDTSNFVPKTRTINGKALSSDITLTATDLGISSNTNASNITTGTLAMKNGGTGADNGKDGLKNLLAAGPMILSSNQYGSKLKFDFLKEENTAVAGQIFFVKVSE